MSRAPRDTAELMELAGDDWRDFASTLEADGRAEGDQTKVEEARIVRREAKRAKPSSSSSGDTKKPAKTDEQKAAESRARAAARRSEARKRRITNAVSPERQATQLVRGGATTMWTVLFGLLVLVIVYQLLTGVQRTVAVWHLIESAFNRVAYPRSVFNPEGWTGRGQTLPPGANDEPRQLIPTPGGGTITGVP